jgi:hypothetical protein
MIPEGQPHEQGRGLAEQVRARLGLGVERIDSMLDLIRALGVTVWCMDGAALPTAISGASVLSGSHAAVLVIRQPQDQWWKTRMTLAHELCHLLVDRGQLEGTRPGAVMLLSPDEASKVSRSIKHDSFEWIEQRARAFAAYLLLPSAGVEMLCAQHATPAQRLHGVMSAYWVGVTTAANNLCDLGAITKTQRASLRKQRVNVPPPAPLPDTIPDDQIGFAAPLLPLIHQGLAAGKLQRGEARGLLDLPSTAYIPPYDSSADAPAWARPTMTPDARRLRRANATVSAQLGDLRASVVALETRADCVIASVHITTRAGELVEQMSIKLSEDLESVIEG